RDRVQDRLDQAQVSTDEVLGVLVSHMRADVTDLFDEGGTFHVESIRKKGLGHLVKKLKVRRIYEGDDKDVPVDIIELEVQGSQSAAVALSKILGMEAPQKHTVEVESVDAAIERELARLAGTSQAGDAGEAPQPTVN